MTSTAMETSVFWIVGTAAILGAVGVVTTRKTVYSAIFLACTMISLAVLYVVAGAPFLGVVQVVVYTGAVLMLFLFVVMLVGVDSAEIPGETIRGQRVTVMATALGFGILLIAGIGRVSVAGSGLGGRDDVSGLAVLIFTKYLWSFELTSALLITAALGAMVLAHRERFCRRKTQRELAAERFRPGGHPTPLPAPGVYARHNAVDVPARLPDGAVCELSVSRTLERRGVVLKLLVADAEEFENVCVEGRVP
ncbi:NADH:ubiquinone oxidoreductase subunit J [Mycolicibacterium mageritense DSM 44476 = CIP 104973]|uniref:NADH-quinone oxidoreductase subunit J n=1 Tax=Mycolicibacterium mageritense TaxID=53462 RepID=A0AAI8TVL5_MYCME|nr:NADH-quinone oxidoreductase subunit J [Mycolicibacterium mageritense]MBN3457730.1 NADH-quinone oxidoreductase subunit J [Mycobacterium sp. DSM 3803]MCC9187044.1 NADH-quinone oxidoreductase subunit J [Mycolicibacterium mageritense]TXI62293.1 MAG: NADH-quinone oxidoreductase subunit J [Mycolicibacterium mageritense]CDO21103.1 NADH dehydrogenase subunit J [Mycolicibacterium mageritense DSM 44476 = CIP 104973]BBX34377.1 NADH:ubiquinone oxidoreductase subunit J [Mycolicibacterium mageritense]